MKITPFQSSERVPTVRVLLYSRLRTHSRSQSTYLFDLFFCPRGAGSLPGPAARAPALYSGHPCREQLHLAQFTQTDHVLSEDHDGDQSIGLVEGGADADVLEGGVEEGASALAGGQTVINQQPLHYLLTISAPEFTDLARPTLQHHELLRPLLQTPMRGTAISRHRVALSQKTSLLVGQHVQSKGPFQFLSESLSGAEVGNEVVDCGHPLSRLDAIPEYPAVEVGEEGLVFGDEVLGGAPRLVEKVEHCLDVLVEVHFKYGNNYKQTNKQGPPTGKSQKLQIYMFFSKMSKRNDILWYMLQGKTECLCLSYNTLIGNKINMALNLNRNGSHIERRKMYVDFPFHNLQSNLPIDWTTPQGESPLRARESFQHNYLRNIYNERVNRQIEERYRRPVDTFRAIPNQITLQKDRDALIKELEHFNSSRIVSAGKYNDPPQQMLSLSSQPELKTQRKLTIDRGTLDLSLNTPINPQNMGSYASLQRSIDPYSLEKGFNRGLMDSYRRYASRPPQSPQNVSVRNLLPDRLSQFLRQRPRQERKSVLRASISHSKHRS